jgi:hypothetical protein
MTDTPGVRPERRGHSRISPKGTVIARAADRSLRGRLSNLGEGGLYMTSNVTPPERWLGRTVDLEIRLDTARAEWLHVAGRVVRLHAGGIAMTFVGAPPAMLLRMIDDQMYASRARSRVISVVLIDADVIRRQIMAHGFRGAGCVVVEAGSPLEAIVRLGESSYEPDVIAVADSQLEGDATHMRRFVELEHPGAKLITIGDEALEPEGILHWLSSSDPKADLSGRVRNILVRPRRG